MEKTIIIVEIGECYNGDLNVAKKLIMTAKEAGCDFAKFQTLDYESISGDDAESKWLKKIALDTQKIDFLIQCGKEMSIPVLFSPENKKTAGWLFDAGLKDIKIGSVLITDEALIEFVNNNFKRVFVSTGRASLDQIHTVVQNLSKVKELYIMHCISEYPTGPLLEERGLKALADEDVRLNMMRMLMQFFPQHKVGYSDHTVGILAPVVAVAMGAKVIEKHITLDRKTPLENFTQRKEYLGTDHALSLEPSELKEMVRQIRKVEKMFGDWKWERSRGEKILMEYFVNLQ